MIKECFEFLKNTNYAMLLVSKPKIKEYSKKMRDILDEIQNGIDGKNDSFVFEFRVQLLGELTNHIVEIAQGVKLKYGIFYYHIDDLAERMLDAEQRCIPKTYKTRFYTISTANIAQSYEYSKTKSYLITEDVMLKKSIHLVDFRGEFGESETICKAIKEEIEKLPYNSVILNLNVEFVLSQIKDLGYAGVIYTSNYTDEDVWVVFEPYKYMASIIHDVIFPEDYQTFFKDET